MADSLNMKAIILHMCTRSRNYVEITLPMRKIEEYLIPQLSLTQAYIIDGCLNLNQLAQTCND